MEICGTRELQLKFRVVFRGVVVFCAETRDVVRARKAVIDVEVWMCI